MNGAVKKLAEALKKILIKKPKTAIMAGLVILFFIFSLFLNVASANKIVYGVKIGNEKIGGKSPEKIKEFLLSEINNIRKQGILLKINTETISVKPAELGIAFNISRNIEKLYQMGRDGNFLSNYFAKIFILITSKKTGIEFEFDYQKFNEFIANKLAKFEKPAENATLTFNAEINEFVLKPSSAGYILNKEKLLSDISDSIANLQKKEIKINFKQDQPKVKDDGVFAAKEKAEKILILAPIVFKYKDKKWEFNKDDILNSLIFKPELAEDGWQLGIFLDEKIILEELTAIAPTINQEPVNAVLTEKNGKIVEFSISQPGLRLDVDKNLTLIIEKIFNFEKEINLAVDEIEPQISTKSIDNLGLTALLAVGESDFAGSPSSRIHNIKIGAAKFNGILIPPEKEFSFNENLGEVDEKSGYKAELVIQKDRTAPEYGGGLCQVSTTLFRAAMQAGLLITERAPHAYPVKYYNPQGFDATIYPPHPDLKFVNDTPSNILIQTKIKGTKLYFELYGTDDERKVEIDGPHTIEVNPDGSMKTILTRKIYDKDGKLVREAIFKSNYKSPDLYPIYRNPLE